MPLVWATRIETRTAAHISEVASGLACSCTCPGCNATLEAVNSENPFWKKRPHFRHYQAPEHDECADASVLRAAREILDKGSAFLTPTSTVRVTVKSRHGKSFSDEREIPGELKEVATYEFIDATDAVLTLTSGEQFYVRLIASGIERSNTTPKQIKYAEVLIDISDPVLRTASREELRAHISLSPSQRKWCGNQVEETVRSQLTRELQDAADEDDRNRDAAAILQAASLPSVERQDPREKLRRLREMFHTKMHAALDEDEPNAPTIPSWSSLAKPQTSLHAFRLHDDETCWVVMSSANHSGYYIVPAPRVFDGWDEALPSSLGVPNLELKAYVGQGSMDVASTWFQHSGRLRALNFDSDAALTLVFAQNQFPEPNDGTSLTGQE
jgi:hypothetical protein